MANHQKINLMENRQEMANMTKNFMEKTNAKIKELEDASEINNRVKDAQVL